MFADIIRFEWRYHTRQFSFLAGAAIFAFFGFVLTIGLGRQEINANSPALIAEVMALLSIVSIFPLTVFSAAAILRDREYGMEEIVFATAIEKSRFLLGRFSGAMLASLTLMLFATAGMIAAPLSGVLDPARTGPIIPLHYLQAFVFIVLPDILFTAAVVFAIAALTRSAPASYVGSVVLYVLYFVAAAFSNSPLMAASKSNAGASMTIGSLLDPFGLTAFFEQTRYWTIPERNSAMVALSGNFLANRVLWVLAAIAILALVNRVYPFRLIADSRRRASKQSDETAPATLPDHTVDQRPRPLEQFISSTRLEVRLLMLNLPFVVLLLTWVFFAVPEVWSPIISGEYGAAFLPMTSLVISRLRQPLAVFGTLALIYWSAEVFWRERSVRIEPIVSATPVSGPVLFASKLAALGTMSGIVALEGVVIGVAIQLILGGAPIEPGVYFGFVLSGLTPLLLFAVGCGVVHTFAPGKYVGLLLTLLLAAFIHRGDVAGVEHHLLRFATAPPVSHSGMAGFDGVTAFAALSIYWALVAASLALFAAILWRRHDDERLASRLGSFGSTSTRRQKVALLSLVVAATAVGIFVFWNTNVLNRYETTDEVLDWKADYEKTWGLHATDPQPRIAAIETSVEIDPDASSLRIDGQYRLTNKSIEPIPRLLVSVRRDATHAELAVDGKQASSVDERFGMYAFDLDQPLSPGDSTTLTFDVEYASRGFTNDGPDRPVASNGSFVMGFLRFPGIGYRKGYEIRNADERTKRGLSPHAGGLIDELGGDDVTPDEWVMVDVTISTSPGQLAVGPGQLVRAWEENGRSYFRFRTDHVIPNVLACVSARYEVTRAIHAGIDIEIYSHPGQKMNVPAILETTRTSLDVFQEAFGPYPHRVLRIAEVPSSAQFGGFATPGLVLLSENRVFYVAGDRDTPVDLVVRRVAHEVAHQWWGHNVVPASVEGGSMLTESLTKHAETLVLERMRGADQMRNLRSVELDRYLSGRVREEEPPLYRSGGQGYLVYSKGLLVMSAVQDLLGSEATASALRSLMAAESGPGGNATTLDLLDQLHAVASPDQARLIDEWMKEVVLYDLAVESAEQRRLPDGRHEVNVTIRASKVHVVAGREEQGEMDELIDLAIHAQDGAPLLLDRARIHNGTNELSFVVENEPGSVEIDPDVLRIDRNRMDNVWRLEAN